MSVSLNDPFNAALDKDLPTLALALDPEIARREFKRRLPGLSAERTLRLRAIRVTRHKPGRRCVVEYDAKVRRQNVPDQLVTLIGKVRNQRSGNEAFRLQSALWEAGFQADSADGVSVPEPIGVISSFKMWFQAKVAGLTVEESLISKDSASLARRIAFERLGLSFDSHVPELDERNRIGELARGGHHLMLAELRDRLDAELRAFVELLDQHPGIGQVVESGAGALERRNQLADLPDHGNAGTSRPGHRLHHARKSMFTDERA